jgi:hypothetical protein
MDALWPHFRTDAVCAVCLVIALFDLVTGRSPGVQVFALGVAAFCAIFPRLEKGFEVSILGMHVHGTLKREEQEEQQNETLKGRDAKPPADSEVKNRR